MADSTIGGLPQAESLFNEGLMVAELQGEAVRVTMKQLKDFLASGFSGGTVPKGGTKGQVLVKASDADNDLAWADPVEIPSASGVSF